MNTQTKHRHGCVTAFLGFMIVVNSLTALTYLFMSDIISQGFPEPPPQSIIMTLVVLAIINTLLSVMLFKWKKWAFYGFAATSLMSLIINLYLGIDFSTSVFGLISIAVLYGVLQIKERGVSAWDHLT